MIPHDKLADFLDDVIEGEERAKLERELENDPEALRLVLDQRKLDRLLASLLGSPERKQRLRESIRASLESSLTDQLREQVIADTSDSVQESAFPGAAALIKDSRHVIATAVYELFGRLRTSATARFAAAAAVLLLGMTAWLAVVSHRPPPGIEVGVLAETMGVPRFLRPGTSEPRDAGVGTIVQLGDRVETGDADRAEIQFRDGTILRLDYNTTVELSTLHSEPATANSPLTRPSEVHLIAGQVWTKVHKTTNAPAYAIRTDVATAVARGTEFGVKLQRVSSAPGAANVQSSTASARGLTPSPGGASNLVAILRVKEGVVDFSNPMGSVQATALTESKASSESAPIEPIRLETIDSFPVGLGLVRKSTPLIELTRGNSGFRLAYSQGWVGLDLIEARQSGAELSLRIIEVKPGSPAANAGLRVGDLVTAVNGKPVTNLSEAFSPIRRSPASTIELAVLRDGATVTVSLKTTQHPLALPLKGVPADQVDELSKITWPLIQATFGDSIEPDHAAEIERNFRGFLAKYPNSAPAHNNLALLYGATGQFGAAVQHYQAAIVHDPANPLYHLNLAMLLLGIGNHERAAEEAQMAVSRAPTWDPAVVGLASAYERLSNYDAALGILEAGLKEHPESEFLWRTKGGICLHAGRLDEALGAALKGVELNPSYFAEFLNLSTIHWARGDVKAAEAAARRAVELNPYSAEAWHSLAIDVMCGGLSDDFPSDPTDPSIEGPILDRWQNRPPDQAARITEAEVYARKAVQLARNEADAAPAKRALSAIYIARGAVDEAEAVLQSLIQQGPDDEAAKYCNYLAWTFAIWGVRLDEALLLAQKAVQLRPADAANVDTLAAVHFRRGEWDQAETGWRKCINLAGPDGDANSWLHLGRVYERKNQPEAAIAAYQEALRLRSDFPEASQALTRLRK